MKNSKENRAALEASVKEFPENPGVYIMRGSSEEIIYIGKAKNLRNRVRSYFSKAASKELKTSHLVKKICTIEVIATTTEYEALILENNLIKKWKPKYNISLKDNKTFPVIRITNEKYPRVFRTRRIIDDGSQYFGPYADIRSIDIYLELIKKRFKTRKCKEIPLRKRKSPCLYNHIGQCDAPCIGAADEKKYKQEISTIRKILSGNITVIAKEFEKKMKNASAAMEYEKAAEYRDILQSLNYFIEEQKVEVIGTETKDFIALISSNINSVIVVLQMREGKISEKSVFNFTSYSENQDNISRFLIQYYSDYFSGSSNIFPEKIIINILPEDNLLTRFFREKFQVNFNPISPSDEKEASIMKMAEENCRLELMRIEKELSYAEALKNLKEKLELSALPVRIEGFDIAHLGGTNTVSSMVSFLNGKPDKSEYRIFRIKSLTNQMIDDYQSIREAVARRYTRLKNENLPMPDLILIDGGKGQLNAAKSVLDALGLEDINIASIAKQEELIFVPHKDEAVRFTEGSMPLRILQHVRDESHRFATSFNKNMRKKELSFSMLEEIPGIGAERSKKLLTEFGNIENIKNSDSYSISEKAKLPVKVAEAVIEYLKDNLKQE